jgi:hypothetical protein
MFGDRTTWINVFRFNVLILGPAMLNLNIVDEFFLNPRLERPMQFFKWLGASLT